MNNNWLRDTIDAAKQRTPDFVLKNAKVVNVFTEEIVEADVALYGGIIIGVGGYGAENEYDCKGAYVTPGFIDSHLSVEASMATPWEFAKVALKCGTTMAIADPRGMANVFGVAGVRFLNNASENVGMDIYYMFPPCVPVTSFEMSNATLTAKEAAQLIWEGTVFGMGAVRDHASVVMADEDLLKKTALFDGRKIDGFAPDLNSEDLAAYMIAGMDTDREFFSFEEVKDELRAGMKVQLRAGESGLMRGIAEERLPVERIMFCSDTKSLLEISGHGHINHNARAAVAAGITPEKAVKMATLNAAIAYRLLNKGAIAPGYDGDLVVFEDLEDFKPRDVFIMGKNIKDVEIKPLPKIEMPFGNSVNYAPMKADKLALRVSGDMPVIEMLDYNYLTALTNETVPEDDGFFAPGGPYAKIACIERHKSSGNIGLGIVKGFGLTQGALATTVAYDSHNIVVLGMNDGDMMAAVSRLKEIGGGYVLVNGGEVLAELPLPIGGLISAEDGGAIERAHENMLSALTKLGLGPEVGDPLARLSHFTLPVLPEARITPLGIYDVANEMFIFNDQDIEDL